MRHIVEEKYRLKERGTAIKSNQNEVLYRHKEKHREG